MGPSACWSFGRHSGITWCVRKQTTCGHASKVSVPSAPPAGAGVAVSGVPARNVRRHRQRRLRQAGGCCGLAGATVAGRGDGAVLRQVSGSTRMHARVACECGARPVSVHCPSVTFRAVRRAILPIREVRRASLPIREVRRASLPIREVRRASLPNLRSRLTPQAAEAARSMGGAPRAAKRRGLPGAARRGAIHGRRRACGEDAAEGFPQRADGADLSRGSIPRRSSHARGCVEPCPASIGAWVLQSL